MKYAHLKKDFLSIQGTTPFSIGKTHLGEDIYAVHIGRYGTKQIIIQGAIHAREWITIPLITELIKKSKALSLDYGIYFLPCTNPDGVRIATEGVDFIKDNKTRDFLIKINGGEDFSLYKANARGVDLNTNFDAQWGMGQYNIRLPSIANYIGSCPNSEKETKALVEFSLSVKPSLTISYHSKGRVVYYGFVTQSTAEFSRDKNIAESLAASLTYQPVPTANSAGGYKDWCNEKLKIPSFTIEVGADSLNHPIEYRHLPNILQENKSIFKVLSTSFLY